MSNFYWSKLKKVITLLCHSVILYLAFGAKAIWLAKKGVIVDTDRDYLLNSSLDFIIAFMSVLIARAIFEGHKQQTLKSLGLKVNLKTVPDLLFGFVLSGVLISFLYIVGIVLGWIHIEKLVWETLPLFSLIKRSSHWLLIFVLVGVWEELVARGYWLHIVKKDFNLILGVIISSSLFAASHLVNPHATWRVALIVFTMGLLLAYSKIRTSALWLPIGFHIGWNFFLTTIFGFSVSGINKFSLLQNSISGPEWLLGGKFGLEDGLLILLAFPFGMIAVYLWTQNRVRRELNS